MIDYMYHGNYTYSTRDGTAKLAAQDRALTMHCKMYDLAINYEIVGLEDAAMSKLAQRLRSPCAAEDYAGALDVVYSSLTDTGRRPRDSIFCRLLDADARHLRSPAMEAVIHKYPELPYDIIEMLPYTLTNSLRENCPMHSREGVVRQIVHCTRCGRRMLICDNVGCTKEAHHHDCPAELEGAAPSGLGPINGRIPLNDAIAGYRIGMRRLIRPSSPLASDEHQ